MKTSTRTTAAATTTVATSFRPDKPVAMKDIRLEPCSPDLAARNGSDRGQRATVTTVQITPMKATPEIADAIRRQTKTGGIGYKSESPSTRNARPLFRAILSGTLQPGATRGPKPISHGQNGSRVASPYSSISSSDSSGLTKQDCPVSHKQKMSTSGFAKVVAGSGGSGSYSIVYNRHGQVASTNANGNTIEPDMKSESEYISPNNTITPRSPRLTLTHRSKGQAVSPDNINKVTYSDSNVTNKDHSLNVSKSANSSTTFHPRQNSAGRDRKLLNDNTDVTCSDGGGNQACSTSQRRDTNRQITRPSSRDRQSPAMHALTKPWTTQTRGSVSRPGSAHGLPCVQLADSILGAVGTDLNHIYQLVHSRVRYAEFIEKSQPHRIDENSCTKNHVQNLSCNTTTSTTKFLNTDMAGTQKSMTSYKRTYVLPDLAMKSKLFQPKIVYLDSSPANSPSSVSPPVSNTDSVKDKGQSCCAETESEVEYDKPVTIIIETNDADTWAKTTRPILKSTARSEVFKVDGTRRLNRNSCNNESNNNNNNDSKNVDGTDHLTPRSTATNFGAVGSEWRGEQSACIESGKGRLVRFCDDDKIHEFTPFEPVTQNPYL